MVYQLNNNHSLEFHHKTKLQWTIIYWHNVDNYKYWLYNSLCTILSCLER